MNKRIRKKREKNSVRYKCICCGNYTFIGGCRSYDICPVCYWEIDDFDENESRMSDLNRVTLGEGRANYKKFGACEEKMIPYVRKPTFYELPENNKQV